ncbi:MAG: hypothetical protein L5655_04355 [Thermosediminibacteraceae bacterium]|nr:hypothetical protein [Thermosediminibacteraceae bacterium]
MPLAIVLMLSYVYVGTRLDTKMDKKYDFLAGSLIAVIGLGFLCEFHSDFTNWYRPFI